MNHPKIRSLTYGVTNLLKRIWFQRNSWFLVCGFLLIVLSANSLVNRHKTAKNTLYDSPERSFVHFKPLKGNTIVAEANGYNLVFEKEKVIISPKESKEEVTLQFDQEVLPSIHESNLKKIIYENIYDKTDLCFYDKGNGQAGYDFILGVGADPTDICLQLDTEVETYVEGNELVQIMSEGTQVRHSEPYAYQTIDGEEIEVTCSFNISENCLEFEVGSYNTEYGLTIDPTISYHSPGNQPMAPMACDLQISDVRIGTCSYDVGSSTSTFQLEVDVDYIDALSGDIEVTIAGPVVGSATQSFNPIGSGIGVNGSETFTFTVTADGTGPHTISAAFNAGGCAAPDDQYTAPIACPPSIGDLVFVDLNCNNTYDPGDDTPIPNITVTLQDLSTFSTTTTVTDANGQYNFPVTPGNTYQVFIDVSTAGNQAAFAAVNSTDSASVPNLFLVGSGDPLYQVVADAGGASREDIDFGFKSELMIGNYIWYDADADGEQDAAESGLAGVTVQLYELDSIYFSEGVSLATNLIGTTVTDANGEYQFDLSNAPTLRAFKPYEVWVNLNDARAINSNITSISPQASIPDKERDSDATLNGGFAKAFAFSAYRPSIFFDFCRSNPQVDIGFAPIPCNVTVGNVTQGNCFYDGTSSSSRVNISVEIFWEGSPTGNLTVSTNMPGVADQTIFSDTSNSPVLLQFEGPSNNTTYNFTASFDLDATCTSSRSFTTPVGCPPSPCVTGTDVGGAIFWDNNSNGSRDSDETSGPANVTVTAYTQNGFAFPPTTSISSGGWSLTIPPDSLPVRIEFTNLPQPASYFGSDNGTAIQFADALGCDFDLGVFNPAGACTPIDVFSICFDPGDPATKSAGAASIIRNGYFQRGGSGPLFATKIGFVNMTGVVWGLGFQDDPNTPRLFASSVLKTNFGLGTLGAANGSLGGIYVTDLTTNTTSPWLDVNTIGIPVGSYLPNASRNLTVGLQVGDPGSVPFVGTRGMGDIDVSEDGETMYIMNVANKKLYSLEIDSDNNFATLPTQADVDSFALPNLCSGGEIRPWAVSVNNGQVYVGMVCDGSAGGTLEGYILRLDGNSFTSILNFPIPMGGTLGNFFVPWNAPGVSSPLAAPLISDIAFHGDGSFTIAMIALTALQYGIGSRNTGETIRVWDDNGTLKIEQNGIAGNLVGQLNLGGGFYDDNTYQSNVHPNATWGGLGSAPGSGEIVLSVLDPYAAVSGGYQYLSINNGAYVASTTTFAGGSPPGFGKSIGAGDIEVSCDPIERLEIGSRAWYDLDGDGVQDAGEEGIPNLNVALYDSATGVQVALKQTSATGEWFFNLTDGLVDTTGYYIVFGTGGQVNPATGIFADPNTGRSWIVTGDSVGFGANMNENDSDVEQGRASNGAPAYAQGLPFLYYRTASQNDHSLDAGMNPGMQLGNLVWSDVNGDGDQDVNEPGIPNVILCIQAYDSLTMIWGPAFDLDGNLVGPETTDANGNYLFEGLAEGTYRVIVKSDNWISGPFAAGNPFADFEPTTGNGGDNQDNTDDNGDQDFINNPDSVQSNGIVLRVGEEPINDGDVSPISDLTIDFGFVGYEVGNFVWLDADNSGDFNTPDGLTAGLANVEVELLDALGMPVDSDPSTVIVEPTLTLTNSDGFYRFGGLGAGSYRIRLTAAQFGSGQPLFDHFPSNGSNGNDDPNSGGGGIDMDDNGLDPTSADYPGTPSTNGILSGVVTLGPSDIEPNGEPNFPPPASSVADGRSNLTVDFGLYTPVRLGDYVWLDIDADGQQDIGTEPPLGDVTLSLLVNNGTGTYQVAVDKEGNTVSDIVTATGVGTYCFEDLPPGEYIVRLSTPPVGLDPTSGGTDDPDIDLDNNDNNGYSNNVSGFVESQPIQLIVNDEPDTPADGDDRDGNKTVDFGFVGYSVGNYVWLDVDGSGNVTVGDGATPGLAGVEIELMNESCVPVDYDLLTPGVQSTTLTDANGFYQFRGLRAGNYIIRVNAGNFSGPLTDLFPSNGFLDETDPDDDGDNNDNGLDPLDPGFAGAFAANGVKSGVVTLGGNPSEPLGENPTASGIAGNDGTNLSDDRTNLSVDFGFYGVVSIGDTVWYDPDVNGTQNRDATEPGIADVELELEVFNPVLGNFVPALDINSVAVSPSTTGVNGLFSFTNLAPADYRIVLTPANWDAGNVFGVGGLYESAMNTIGQGLDDGNPDDDNAGPDFVVAPPDGVITSTISLDYEGEGNRTPTSDINRDASVDIGMFRGLSLGNRIFFDLNNNCVLDVGEEGVDGVTVYLYEADVNGNPTGTAIDTVITQPDPVSGREGYYLFTLLPPRDYVVVIPELNFRPGAILEGYFSSKTSITVNGAIVETTSPDPDVLEVDGDDNGDKVSDPLSPFFGAVVSPAVTLDPAAPGEPLNEPDPTPDPPFENPVPDFLTNETVDFGFYRAQMGNLVWDDENNDGVFNNSEATLPAVEIQLYAADNATQIPIGADGRLGTADDQNSVYTTDGSGGFSIEFLPEGDYIIKAVPPQGYISSTGRVGWALGPYEEAPDADIVITDDDDNGQQEVYPAREGERVCTKVVTLDPGNEPEVDANTGTTTDNFIDIGLFEPLSVGNLVWEDDGPCNLSFGNNGIYDPSHEDPIDSVLLHIYYDSNGDGEPEALINSDSSCQGNGFFLFDYLIEGSYVIQVDPANFAPGAALDSMISSTVTEIDPNILNIDNNDNGLDDSDRRTNGIFSGSIELVDDDEPENENPLKPVVLQGSPDDDNANMTVDFGFVIPGYFGDYVWDDMNNDGIQGDPAQEPPVEGVIVRLYEWTGVAPPSPQADILIETDTTDQFGKYYFEELPPCREYYVEFLNLPPDYEVTRTNQGPNDSIDSDVLRITQLTSPTVIEPAEADTTWDAGLFLPKASIGDYVWDDENENGYQDNGEMGVSGVRVVLYNCNGDSIDQTFTNGLGRYEFTELIPGDYYVAFKDLPVGYVFSPKDNHPNDQADSDADPASGETECTRLDPREDDVSWDAGIYLPKASLGDRVWEDDDQDGEQDPTEVGVANIKVVLYTCAGDSVDETLTGPTGLYLFEELTPDDYYVIFTDIPAGYVFSDQDALGNDDVNDSDADPSGQTACTTLDPGEDERDLDAGIYLPPASIGNFVWEDLNENGLQDLNEPGVPNVRVVLETPSGPQYIDTTDANGFYYFLGLPPGDYKLRFYNLPTDYVISPQDVGNDEEKDSDVDPVTGMTIFTTLDPGEDDPSWDMGIFLPKASLGDKVWEDEDEDGIQDPNEPGVANIRVVLYTCAGDSLDQQFTDVNGEYGFDNLPAGDYYVVFNDLPAGFVFSPQDAASFDSDDSDADPTTGQTTCVSLDPGEDDLTVDAGIYLPKASLGDCVWYDENEDGVQDLGEDGVAGVKVSLYDGAGNFIADQFTNLLGKYKFENLTPDDYYVEFSNLPPDWVFSPQDTPSDDAKDSDADPATGRTVTTTLDPGENDLSWDAGIYIPRASLGDRVWYDTNENGSQDPGEDGVSGVKVVLHDCSGTELDSIYTDNNGNYLFADLLPDDYYVSFELPNGFVFSPQDNAADDADSDANANGRTACTQLAAGEDERDLDAGIYEPKAKLGDRVWEDSDEDGEQDPGENGVANVRVVLYNCAGDSITETFTDADGLYLFTDLVPGDYYVVFKDLPTGYGFSPQDATTDAADSDADQDGQTACTSLEPGEEDRTHDAGIIPPTAELGDKVWEDYDEDGEQDPNEPGVPNIRVVLYTCAGDSLDQQITDANGNYLFTMLPPGDYYIVFNDVPQGYIFTQQDAGGDDANDSDADATGQTACVKLGPGESNRTPDAGITPDRLTVCAATDFDVNQYGMLFNSGTFPGTDNRYAFTPGTGEFITYANGTARLTGCFVNMSDANLGFDVDVRFVNRKDYGEWSAQGGKVKGAQNGPFMTWDFFEIDSLQSRLIGKDNLAGEVLTISHMPVSREFGPQLGDGANDRNGDYGMSGWWFFNSESGNYSGSGDFNVSLDSCVDHNTTPIAPRLGGLALLEGPYDASAGLMRASLSTQGILPQVQPFNAAPWNYNGTEQLAAAMHDSIVDWVLVELRDVNDPKVVLSQQAGLLQRHGQIVQSDGHSLLEMPQGITSAYLVVYNWNHLPVMSAQPIQLHGKVFYYDFTKGMNHIYRDLQVPNVPAALLPGGITLLHQGDATGDGQINSLDLGQVMQQYFQTGSAKQDVNLDGVINSLDVGRAMSNYFTRTHVPK